MVFCFILTFCCLVSNVYGVDRDRLARKPWPQEGFDVNKYVGDWYIQHWYLPCSWSGSRKFSNFVTTYSTRQDGSVFLQDTYRDRNGICTTVKSILRPNSRPGCYLNQDPIGDVLSGSNVVVATDYKTFAVKWGCTKDSAYGDCADGYVLTKTRHPDPNPYTLRTIKLILKKLYSLTLEEMVRFYHDKPCKQIAKEPQTSVQYLRKRY